MKEEEKKIIDEFMDVVHQTYPLLDHLNDRRYDQSWSDLMPVIEKIRHKGGDIAIYNTATSITHSQMNEEILNYSFLENPRLKACYKSVVEFIEWHNTNNKIQ